MNLFWITIFYLWATLVAGSVYLVMAISHGLDGKTFMMVADLVATTMYWFCFGFFGRRWGLLRWPR